MRCRCCGNHQHTVVFHQEPWDVAACRSCGFGTLEPIPLPSALDAIYRNPAYFTEQESPAAARDAHRKIGVVRSLLPPRAQILDYGCGAGAFLRESIRYGLRSCGYDVSPYAAERARSVAGCSVQSGPLSSVQLHDHTLDAITAFDVIEHLVDWTPTFNVWARCIKPGGILVLTTPNLRSWDAQLLRRHWYGFRKIPEHVNYFTPQSITRVLADHGFVVERIVRWGFVRSFSFIADRIAPTTIAGRALRSVLQWIPLRNLTPFVPMVDMLVIARAV